eukprot:1224494-Prymnesium_polylepis.1
MGVAAAAERTDGLCVPARARTRASRRKDPIDARRRRTMSLCVFMYACACTCGSFLLRARRRLASAAGSVRSFFPRNFAWIITADLLCSSFSFCARLRCAYPLAPAPNLAEASASCFACSSLARSSCAIFFCATASRASLRRAPQGTLRVRGRRPRAGAGEQRCVVDPAGSARVVRACVKQRTCRAWRTGWRARRNFRPRPYPS